MKEGVWEEVGLRDSLASMLSKRLFDRILLNNSSIQNKIKKTDVQVYQTGSKADSLVVEVLILILILISDLSVLILILILIHSHLGRRVDLCPGHLPQVQ